MATVIFDDVTLQIPAWVSDLTSFRRWAESDEFPEEGRVCFINGEVWADMSMQQIFSHLAVKNAINITVGALVAKAGAGRYWPDGLRLFSDTADLSAVPDGSYISFEALRTGRVKLVEGREGGYTAVEGAPELVIEVVSDSSEEKDYEWQMSAYWEADVQEYWVIDARTTPIRFDVYRSGPKGFVITRKAGGWAKSTVLGKTFRLDMVPDPLGNPDYALRVR
jgi:Uma2 family endonuclease